MALKAQSKGRGCFPIFLMVDFPEAIYWNVTAFRLTDPQRAESPPLPDVHQVLQSLSGVTWR